MMKGISPIIATVILIAVTLAIAGMLSLWATTFMQGRQSAFEQQLECTGALDIDAKAPSLVYRDGNLTLILINNKDFALMNITAIVTYPNSPVINYEFGISLAPRQAKSTSVAGNPEKPVRIRLASAECPLLAETSVP